MIKIAVIGVGRWGVHLLRNFLEHPQAKVVAVVDSNPERLAAVKQQYNLEHSVLLATEWQAIQQVVGLEAVAIATPASTHYSLITDAISWGYHVLAEKPLTLNPIESWKVCQLAQQRQRQLMVDHTYLFHPAVERGEVVVQAGTLGDLRYGYATRTHLGPVRQDVDVLWDLAIHDIAIFNFWLNQIPISVQAMGKVWLQPKKQPAPLADLVWVILNYPNGFQAYIHLCWLNPDKQRRLGVVGSNGSLIFDEMSLSSPLTLLHGEFEQRDHQFIPINQRQQVLEIAAAEPLQRVCDRFIHCVLTNTPPVVSSGWVGTKLVEILTALEESQNQGGKLVFLKKN
ncbi:Gfo/Idh/MocA family oxidoreductase [Aetokthonos hydrillicola Thurmond2011]|jgi:predicted dehydrogenase|uniref:Gfo/Idh/MocA family oxidoreductase n=1 Tax=Aetokthonos hydrillicola Thurmond2011 TaxID=2712845 RepID=A0AAP5IBE9_9CYAN|nr:Gfo/Idh/MocA family oxidoreductase [Aetokthonos hydrillicola]MBO3462480.1 Gfo/Idh/MocA family oxidoreductase [Aetokthonos hydrillicola CCALA 1050]MBW4588686.1 Gfo/Idh/MocA family oxidoreductase [Aetokthonos hydrillicola CCALA 1050]MDR9895980.1 Gfo/Idh/MocA family oxidoreductase [Aetokthonos hydrillicola Thurmond2011]